MFRLRVCTRLASGLPNSCAQSRWTSSVPTSQTMNSQEKDVQELVSFFPVILDAVREAVRPCRVPSESEWLVKVVDYVASGVRWPSSLCTLNAMRELSGQPRDAVDPEIIRKAKYLAWCHELTIAAYNIADDLVDGGEMRWDKPSWHRRPDVGLSAVNDAFLVENVVYSLLRQQFKGSPCYEDLLELFMNTTLSFMLGQNYDAHSAYQGRALFEDFTPGRYEDTVRLKASEITFYSPVVAAMLATGAKDPGAFQVARDISMDLAMIMQSQDDYTDCFGVDRQDMCLDIRNGTCTWMIVEAKKRASTDQMKVLKENYGYDDQSKIDNVKAIYSQLRLKDALLDYHRVTTNAIEAKIEQNAHKIPPNIYKYVLETMQQSSAEWYQRNIIH